jgi:hypothetical protein
VITAGQLVAHAIGDYVLQSDWMAQEKTSRHLPAAAHALTYGLPFLVFRPSLAAFAVIVGTHFIIDRWRLARHLVYAKNQAAPARHRYPWSEAQPTGYHESRAPWMTVWLMIVADNVAHVLINGAALAYL